MYEVGEPKKPVKLTKIPSGLSDLRLYLNSNIIAVDVSSDSLTVCNLNSCYQVKSIKLHANVHWFTITDDMPLESLILESSVSAVQHRGTFLI